MTGSSAEFQEWLWKLTDMTPIIRDEKMLRDSLASLTSEIGYEFYAFTHIRPVNPFAVSNYPDKWQRIYVEHRYDQLDPVVAHARHQPEIFAWGDDNRIFRQTADTKRFLATASEYGIRSGISMPIRSPFGNLVILTIASGDRTTPVALAGYAAAAASAVALLHARVEDMQLYAAMEDRPSLNNRQAMMLRWSAEGKHVRDIALIEKVSCHNVSFHLNKARRALNANTIAQATAIATKLKLI